MSKFEIITVIYYTTNTTIAIINLAIKLYKASHDKKAAQDQDSQSD